jgi:hypothetical protein
MMFIKTGLALDNLLLPACDLCYSWFFDGYIVGCVYGCIGGCIDDCIVSVGVGFAVAVVFRCWCLCPLQS